MPHSYPLHSSTVHNICQRLKENLEDCHQLGWVLLVDGFGRKGNVTNMLDPEVGHAVLGLLDSALRRHIFGELVHPLAVRCAKA